MLATTRAPSECFRPSEGFLRGVSAANTRRPGSSVRKMTTEDDSPDPAEPVADDELIEDELIIEEISIDGMCGVY